MTKNYQDLLLNLVRRENISITLFLANGFQIRGLVRGFDNYVLIVESEGKHQMIYKHAISTIVPHRQVRELFENYEAGEGEVERA
jgi:host factor-I protein